MPFCTNCGAQLEPDASFCASCGTAVGAEPEITSGLEAATAPSQSAPQAASEPETVGLGLRFAAHLIDVIVVFILYWIIGSTIADMTNATTPEGFELEGGPALAAMLLTFIASILYFALTETYWGGQTLGKKLVGIKVTSDDGSPCGFNQAVVRNVARLVDGFFFYLVGIILILRSPKNQRLGDRIGNTIVVRKPKDADQAGSGPRSKSEKKSSIRPSWGIRKGDYDDI
jgi:uncharacterized RDD family membrane protein YckC